MPERERQEFERVRQGWTDAHVEALVDLSRVIIVL